jgi:hypothetical protein
MLTSMLLFDGINTAYPKMISISGPITPHCEGPYPILEREFA